MEQQTDALRETLDARLHAAEREGREVIPLTVVELRTVVIRLEQPPRRAADYLPTGFLRGALIGILLVLPFWLLVLWLVGWL